MLRAYNAEADYAVRAMRPHRLSSLVDRLYKSRETIARLGATMHIRITDEYHNARVRELELTADFLQKKEEEKEAQREVRAREREEAAVQRELDRQREKPNKELGQYQSALERLRERGDEAGVAEMEAKLAEIENALQDVESRAANVRAGYVYVISKHRRLRRSYGEDRHDASTRTSGARLRVEWRGRALPFRCARADLQ
jgi:chromosome segregation ATPase